MCWIDDCGKDCFGEDQQALSAADALAAAVGDHYCAEDECTLASALAEYRKIRPQEVVVDHLNGNSMDNRRENLDVCTNRENASRYYRADDVGIAPNRGRWLARLHLGCFDTKESARAARNEALRRLGDDWFPGQPGQE